MFFLRVSVQTLWLVEAETLHSLFTLPLMTAISVVVKIYKQNVLVSIAFHSSVWQSQVHVEVNANRKTKTWLMGLIWNTYRSEIYYKTGCGQEKIPVDSVVFHAAKREFLWRRTSN